MGGSGAGSFEGFQPIVEIVAGNPEAQKYGRMWEHPEYRAVSPGEGLAQLFLQIARPKPGSEIIDFGCGTGRGGLMLAVLGGMKVTLVDFVRNSLDEDLKDMLVTQKHVLRFLKHDLEQKLPIAAEYGFCCDVMEHIPTDKVERVLANVLMAAQHVFFSISTVDDSCGKLEGETLHLTVKPPAWWADQFQKLGCMVHWYKESPGAVVFYVSAWQTGEALVEVGVLNTTDQVVIDNVKANINGPYGAQTISPHLTNTMEVMILGGGPSLKLHLDQIRNMRMDGVKLITLNGAYNWALAHDLKPSAQVVCDAREFNNRFTRPVVDDCKYLIASQVHPSVLEGLPLDRTLLWHTTADFIYPTLKERYDLCFPVPGGSTVLLRTIPLMRTLGFKKFHLFGCDSCVVSVGADGTLHHAYQQAENDADRIMPVVVGGRTFGCTAWMVSQAQEFQDLIRGLGDEIELEVYGDGLLAWILKVAANADGDFIGVSLKSDETIDLV